MSHEISDDDLLALQAHFEQTLATNTFQKNILLPAANLYQETLRKNLTDLEIDLGEAIKEYNAVDHETALSKPKSPFCQQKEFLTSGDL